MSSLLLLGLLERVRFAGRDHAIMPWSCHDGRHCIHLVALQSAVSTAVTAFLEVVTSP
jgi:hypothetical protein